MKGRKPAASRFKRAFIIAAAALGFGAGTVTLDSIPKDPVTDTQIVLSESAVAPSGINISPSDQLWKHTLGMRAQSTLDDQMMQAAASGDSWRVQALFDHGMTGRSDIAAQALAQAAYFGHQDVVNTLLRNSVDPTANDGAALLAAIRGGHTGIALQMMDLGVRADVQDNEAIRLAAFSGDYFMTYMLLDRGADPRSSDNAALTYAQVMGHDGVASLLQQSIDAKNAADLAASPVPFSGDIEGVSARTQSPFSPWQYRGPGFDNGPF